MLNYNIDISDKFCTSDSINDINTIGLAVKYSNSVMLESYSNDISHNYIEQHSYASDDNVNICGQYGTEYDNYDPDGYEHYPPSGGSAG